MKAWHIGLALTIICSYFAIGFIVTTWRVFGSCPESIDAMCTFFTWVYGILAFAVSCCTAGIGLTTWEVYSNTKK